MRVWDIALKDLLQILKDRKSLIFLLVMPIAFTVFFGVVFGSAGGESDPRLPVGFINRDAGGLLSDGLGELLAHSDVVRVETLRPGDDTAGAEQVRRDKLAALVIVPAGFTAGALAGSAPRVTVICDEMTQGGHMARRAIETNMVRLLVSPQIGRLSVQAFETIAPLPNDAARREFIAQAAAQALAAWADPPITLRTELGMAPPKKETAMGYAQASPGMIVQFAVYGLLTAGTVLVIERKSRTLQRLLTTPATRAEIIGGKMLAMFLMVLAQELVLVTVGQFAFGVDYFREPLAILLVLAALALWAASLGLFIGAVSTSEEMVIVWTLLAMFALSALGGAWFPLEIAGKGFSAVGHLLPTAWAMDGLQNVVVRGLGPASAAAPVCVLVGYAAVLFGLAIWRLRFE